MDNEDYNRAVEFGLTTEDRWENGTNHHPMSERLFNFLAVHDFKDYDDYFDWSSGGDGDNGETMMYQMDAFFEMVDKFNAADLHRLLMDSDKDKL